MNMSLIRCVGALWLLSLPSIQLLGQQEPTNQPDPRLDQALQILETGDLAGGIAILEGMREEGAAAPPVLGLLGALYLEAGRPLEAFETLEPLTQLEYADPAVLYNAGRSALALNRSERAESLLQRSRRREPRSPAAR